MDFHGSKMDLDEFDIFLETLLLRPIHVFAKTILKNLRSSSYVFLDTLYFIYFRYFIYFYTTSAALISLNIS